MKNYLKQTVKAALLIACFSGLLLFQGCQKQEKTAPFPGGFIHQAFFWLNEPSNPTARLEFESGIGLLLNTESIVTSHFGVPSPVKKFGGTSNNYTYAVTIIFKSAEEYQQFLDNQRYSDFSTQYSHLWSKIEVYNIVDKQPKNEGSEKTK